MSNIKYDQDEVRRLLELRLAENLTYSQVAERFDIPVHVLTHRATQDRKARRLEALRSSSFVEVVSSTERASSNGDNCSGIELVLSGGVRARLDRQFDEVALKRVLSVVPC